jgi:hypothetical protein
MMYGAPRPAELPSPALVPRWFWELQNAFNDIAHGVLPDIDFPLSFLHGVEYGAASNMEHYRAVFQLMKLARDEGLERAQSVLTDAATVTCNGGPANQGLLHYRKYFGALHPMNLGNEPGDHISFIGARCVCLG